MTSPCTVVDVAPLLLAVAEAHVRRGEVPRHIVALYDAVYAWKTATGVPAAGHNVAVYALDRETGLLRVQAGFPVASPFPATETVRCIMLAGGRAAHALHVGPYADLPQTYAALYRWSAESGLALHGESWEAYGDWCEDPARLQTGLYLRLR